MADGRTSTSCGSCLDQLPGQGLTRRFILRGGPVRAAFVVTKMTTHLRTIDQNELGSASGHAARLLAFLRRGEARSVVKGEHVHGSEPHKNGTHNREGESVTAAGTSLRKSFALLLTTIGALVALLAFAGGAGAMTGSASTTATPWIASDLPDYAPGSTVHLTGGNWQPGEAVQILTNDTIGNTWSKTDDVTAELVASFTSA